MRAVCDAGPLIALAKLGQLGLLLKLYDDILIPREVYDEVVTQGLRVGAPDAEAVEAAVREHGIRVVEVTLPAPSPSWMQAVHVGERAAIVLAQQEAADCAVIDDALARQAARRAGVRLQGTVGLLLDAFRQDHIGLPQLEALIERIKADPTLWIGERLCEEALDQARKRHR